MAKSVASLQLAGLSLSWQEYFKPSEHDYHLLSLPRYAWNEKDYWIPYIGTWTLDKAHLKHGGAAPAQKNNRSLMPSSRGGLRTSDIHYTVSEDISTKIAKLCVTSDMQPPDFLGAANGHKMNGCGVATTPIWSDMAYAVGEYLYKKLAPRYPAASMSLCNFVTVQAQIASNDSSQPQLIALDAELNIDAMSMSLAWYAVDSDAQAIAKEPFATGTVRFEDPDTWRAEWNRMKHLVLGRVHDLEKMADQGRANHLSKGLTYRLFGNLVEYAQQYRGIDSTIIHDYEATARVTLAPDLHGHWHTPPHWIDSICHLAGLIMNVSDASNTHDFFYITPGYETFRLAEPLIAAETYRTYVHMFPSLQDNAMWSGDLFVIREDTIIGMLGQIKFRRFPRLLLERFLSQAGATDHGRATEQRDSARMAKSNESGYQFHGHAKAAKPTIQHRQVSRRGSVASVASSAHVLNMQSERPPRLSSELANGVNTPPDSGGSSSETEEPLAPLDDSKLIMPCLELIARETNLDVSQLSADASFTSLGVDSLMSLVLSEKMQKELGTSIKSSLFLECPTVGELEAWLRQHV